MGKKNAEKKRISSDIKIEKVLIENFVALQKVMTNLSIRFEQLSDRIDKLLELFEISAKALAEKEYSAGKSTKDSEKIIKKIDSLFEQNKIIARGLTLLHEGEEKENMDVPVQVIKQPIPSPNYMQLQGQPDINQYQKSISSRAMPSREFKRIQRE